MDMVQCRLTDEEITMAVEAVPNRGVSVTPTAWGLRFDRAIADAATEKALRSVLLWLQEFEGMHSSRAEEIIAIGRGHGLEMAAEELEAMLAAGGS